MTLKQVQEIAQKMGITTGKKTISNLIQEIQIKEGNTPCFGSSSGKCPYWSSCCWADNCLGIFGIVQSRHTFEVI